MLNKQLFRKKTIEDIVKQSKANDAEHGALGKHLGLRDLVAFGIAAIIGAGIFSTIGKASADAGPAVVFLFIFTAIACGFAAFAYAEFASLVPVSGSAYTYSYVAFGELFAWIIGWALIMEYAIGNITIAISWSDYFTTLLHNNLNIHLPEWMTTDFFTAKAGFETIEARLADGVSFEALQNSTSYAGAADSYLAWKDAPMLGNLHVVFDLPAMFIVGLITWLVYLGMRESKTAANIMVAIKLIIVMLVIAVGFFYIDSENYDPFMPNGIGGILAGISSVFFAYIGFDAISTTAEECKDPQRDLPRSIILSIIICTVLYILIALVITGLLHYELLDVGDPLARIFEDIAELKWLATVVSLSAVVALAGVLLVFQMGQPRIWMSMSRDGLLPKMFSAIHPKYKTPYKATIVVGFLVGIPILFIDLELATDMCSIGTLFAFVLVCAGVIKLNQMKDAPERKFKTPFVDGKFILPILLILSAIISFTYFEKETKHFLTNAPVIKAADEIDFTEEDVKNVKAFVAENHYLLYEKNHRDEIEVLLTVQDKDESDYLMALRESGIGEEKIYKKGSALFNERIPFYIFLLVCVFVSISSLFKVYSLIPTLGMLCCLYMMSELGSSNWLAFTIWLVIGLVIYFSYSIKHSVLGKKIQR